jgi:hypothetical protein
MEAKVDIRKLQLLNDCINRTIEALNQVRLSVHAGGLAHSAQMGLQGIGTPSYFGGFPGSYLGAYTTPFGINPQAAAAMVPGFANVGGFPGYQNAFAANAGLGHSAVDPRVAWDWTQDPYTTARIAQTFPFVHWGQSPFAWPNV